MALVIVAGALPLFSQDRTPVKLDLKDAVEAALTKSIQPKIAESGVKIAAEKVNEAKSGRLPFVQFSQSAIRSNNPVFVFGSLLEQGRFGAANFQVDLLNHPNGIFNFRSLVGAQMPIFDQYQIRSRVRQAVAAKSQAELQTEAIRQKLRFDVINTYYGAVLGTEMIKVRSEAIRSAEANRKKTKDMVDVGMTTEADLLAAEVELANATQNRLEAENDLVTTLATLNITLGDKPETQLELTGDLREKYFPVDDRDALIRIALENRPDYQKAELAVENGRIQTQALRDQKLPRVDGFGNFGYSSPYIANGSSDYTVGVNLTYTIFDAGRKSRTQQAAEAVSMAELEKQNLADAIRLDVIRSLQNYSTARGKIQVSIKSTAYAEEALRIVQDRYKFGLTTFNEVLRAESAVVAAKQNILKARYDYYVSFASILLATGRLSDVRLFD
ncbi:MAG TPA: TolC family protein [Pyrinomonadaceae bacterium]|nr:TolC family protein [Chloracidobacterium sp.]MBP9935830.1 TolC family protein [Pyrinomonadaceae bacterium]MBK7803005.1 TolC family protein [Chloracidobacterium sp.]MBK9438345.1 TolC family protein [Chloracidobacterium sp.]MBL0240770.1 TolC family protein [Chloracidobacterium sp.]